MYLGWAILVFCVLGCLLLVFVAAAVANLCYFLADSCVLWRLLRGANANFAQMEAGLADR
jgi:hypothetical protein